MDKLVKIKYHAQFLRDILEDASDVISFADYGEFRNQLDNFLIAPPIQRTDLLTAIQDGSLFLELTEDLKTFEQKGEEEK